MKNTLAHTTPELQEQYVSTVNSVPNDSTGSQRLQVIIEAKSVQTQETTGYSQRVLDFQGVAKGIYTLCVCLVILTIAVTSAMNIWYAIKNNDPSLLENAPSPYELLQPYETPNIVVPIKA